MRHRWWCLAIAAGCAVVGGNTLNLPTLRAAEGDAEGSLEARVRRLVRLGAVSFAPSLGVANAAPVSDEIRRILQEVLSQNSGLVISTRDTATVRSQFRLDTEIVRAGVFPAGQLSKAGVVMWATLTDVATGSEVARERFSAVVEAPGGGPRDLSALANGAGANAPLTQALQEVSAHVERFMVEKLQGFPWQARVLSVGQLKAKNILDEEAIYGSVVLDCGPKAGLKKGDRLHLRRYSEEVRGANGQLLARTASAPLRELEVLEVRTDGTVLARTDIPWRDLKPEQQPHTGDLTRLGTMDENRDAFTRPFVIKDLTNNRASEDETLAVASMVQQIVRENLLQRYGKGKADAKNTKLEASGFAQRTKLGAPVEVTVRITGKLNGKAVDFKPIVRLGDPDLPSTVALQVWKEVETNLEGKFIPGSPVHKDAAQVAFLKGIPDSDFNTNRPDFPLTVRIDRQQAEYPIGSRLKVDVVSPERDCYIQVWNINHRGKCKQVWPYGENGVRHNAEKAFLKKGAVLRLPPDPSPGFPITLPTGVDYLAVVALKQGDQGKQLYKHLAAVVQSAYLPEDDKDRLDVIPPGGLMGEQVLKVAMSRGLGPALEEAEKKTDETAKVDMNDPSTWGSLFAAAVTSWRTVEAGGPKVNALLPSPTARGFAASRRR